jgi:hypothetical protein
LGLELPSFQSQPPKSLGLQAWATGTQLIWLICHCWYHLGHLIQDTVFVSFLPCEFILSSSHSLICGSKSLSLV